VISVSSLLAPFGSPEHLWLALILQFEGACFPFEFISSHLPCVAWKRMAAKKLRLTHVLDHFRNSGVSKKYHIDSCKFCGDALKRLGLGTGVLKAHLACKAVSCMKVPGDVRDALKAWKGAVSIGKDL
jgi:hypothetical protein